MTDNLIEEVLRHDAEMTKGPWTRWGDKLHPFQHWLGSAADEGAGDIVCRPPDGDCEESLKRWPANMHGIACYRTAAPKLARALKRAAEALEDIQRRGDSAIPSYEKAALALAYITKILSEP